jgi:hypothetical protein
MDVIYIFFFIFRNTMGCNGSKGISKNPAKSVTTRNDRQELSIILFRGTEAPFENVSVCSCSFRADICVVD